MSHRLSMCAKGVNCKIFCGSEVPRWWHLDFEWTHFEKAPSDHFEGWERPLVASQGMFCILTTQAPAAHNNTLKERSADYLSL